MAKKIKVRIISTPPGFAPESIRKAWVGLTLLSTGKEDPKSQGSPFRRGSQNIGGYEVLGTDALDALEKKDPEAALWWKQNLPSLTRGGSLVFKAEVCEVIPD